jgi:hypothetical protein
MPLTTRHRDGRRLDSTDASVWAEVHKPGYLGLFCPECDYAMHAVAGGRRRIRHFAHNPGRSDACTFVTGESLEHLRTKALIADAVRLLDGWSAEIEAPGDGWRADVLAIGPHPDELGVRRIAFEPQFSYIHPDAARERTERHRSSGVETVWLPTSPRVEHVSMFTWARLHYGGPDAVEASAHQLNHEPEDGDPKPPWWRPLRLNVADFVRAVCLGEITGDGGVWASDAQRAEFARREQAAILHRKAQEALRIEKAAALRDKRAAYRSEHRWGRPEPAGSAEEALATLRRQWADATPKDRAEIEVLGQAVLVWIETPSACTCPDPSCQPTGSPRA